MHPQETAKMNTIRKLAWVFAIATAVTIFFISSITFPTGPAGPPSYFSVIYHFFAFFWLAFFLVVAVNRIWIIGPAILYALLDEIHQYFVPGRACTLTDFMIDCIGIFSAALICYIIVALQTKE